MRNRSELPAPVTGSAAPPAAGLLSPPSLVEGEDAAAYNALLARVAATLQPANILEEIWVRDVVDLVQEGLRLRRLKADFLTGCGREGLLETLSRLLVGSPNDLVRQARAGDQAAIDVIEAALSTAGLTLEGITARSLMLRFGDLERIERVSTTLDARRHLVLRELDRHRALARAMNWPKPAVEKPAQQAIAADKPAPKAAA